MRTSITLLPAMLLLAACGTLQETAQVRDDAYDIPDRNAVASVSTAPMEEPAKPNTSDDYYDPGQARQYDQGSWYDQAYNDPRWYNQDRFGFGVGVNGWGSNYGMGMNYGWSNNGWYNSPTGWYNPYWSNSWQSGYGYWNNPWYGNYGYYNPWNSGYYGCCDPWGWNNNYYNGWGYNNGWGCNNGGYGYGGWNNFEGFGSWTVAHRPSMSGGGNPGGADVNVVPRGARPNPNLSLLNNARPDAMRNDRRPDKKPVITTEPPKERQRDTWQRTDRQERQQRPDRQREDRKDRSPGIDTGNGGGNRGGGGSSPSPSPSPRPRR